MVLDVIGLKSFIKINYTFNIKNVNVEKKINSIK